MPNRSYMPGTNTEKFEMWKRPDQNVKWWDAPGRISSRSCSISVGSYFQKLYNRCLEAGKLTELVQGEQELSITDSSYSNMLYDIRRDFQQMVPETVLLNPHLPNPKARLLPDWTESIKSGVPQYIREAIRDFGLLTGSGGFMAYCSGNNLESMEVEHPDTNPVISVSFEWVLYPDLDKGAFIELLVEPEMRIQASKALGFSRINTYSWDKFMNYVAHALINPYLQEQACIVPTGVAHEAPFKNVAKGQFNEVQITRETRLPLEHFHMGGLPVVDGTAVLRDGWYLSSRCLPIEIVWGNHPKTGNREAFFFTKFLSVITEKPASHMTHNKQAYGCLSVFPSETGMCVIADVDKLPVRLQSSRYFTGTWDVRHKELNVPDVGVFNVAGKRIY